MQGGNDSAQYAIPPRAARPYRVSRVPSTANSLASPRLGVRFGFHRRIDSRAPLSALLYSGPIGADTIVVGVHRRWPRLVSSSKPPSRQADRCHPPWILAATTLIFLYTKALARRRALNGNARPAFVTDRKSPDQFFSLSAIGSISYPMALYPFGRFSYIRASMGT
jgi:hypothetical protein